MRLAVSTEVAPQIDQRQTAACPGTPTAAPEPAWIARMRTACGNRIVCWGGWLDPPALDGGQPGLGARLAGRSPSGPRPAPAPSAAGRRVIGRRRALPLTSPNSGGAPIGARSFEAVLRRQGIKARKTLPPCLGEPRCTPGSASFSPGETDGSASLTQYLLTLGDGARRT